MTEAQNAIAWLIELIGETARNCDHTNKEDMETRLMKIDSFVYAISVLQAHS